jgi:hypothetical protein
MPHRWHEMGRGGTGKSRRAQGLCTAVQSHSIQCTQTHQRLLRSGKAVSPPLGAPPCCKHCSSNLCVHTSVVAPKSTNTSQRRILSAHFQDIAPVMLHCLVRSQHSQQAIRHALPACAGLACASGVLLPAHIFEDIRRTEKHRSLRHFVFYCDAFCSCHSSSVACKCRCCMRHLANFADMTQACRRMLVWVHDFVSDAIAT